MTQAAKAGDTLRIHFTGRLEDGTVFEESEGDAPLEFMLGTGDVIPGLDQGVVGMAAGETRVLRIAPEEAYGLRDEARVQTIPLEAVPDHIPTELGTQLQIQTEDGQTVPVVVSDKTDSNVELDANHPLAGKTLIFNVTLVEIA